MDIPWDRLEDSGRGKGSFSTGFLSITPSECAHRKKDRIAQTVSRRFEALIFFRARSTR
jgi:hypothetical protein